MGTRTANRKIVVALFYTKQTPTYTVTRNSWSLENDLPKFARVHAKFELWSDVTSREILLTGNKNLCWPRANCRAWWDLHYCPQLYDILCEIQGKKCLWDETLEWNVCTAIVNLLQYCALFKICLSLRPCSCWWKSFQTNSSLPRWNSKSWLRLFQLRKNFTVEGAWVGPTAVPWGFIWSYLT